MSLIKKAKANASTGLLFFAIKIVVTLIMNPLLIQYLGSIHFGIWKAIENILGFASVADGKATQALKWTIANQESSNDFDKKRRSVSSAIIIWILFLPLLAVIVSLLIIYSPHLINNLSPVDYGLVSIVILLLGINLIITPLVGIPESLIIGTNKGYIANYINIIWVIIAAITTFIVLYLGYGLLEITTVILLTTLARGINTFILAKKRIEWLGIRKPSKLEIKSFFKFSSWVLAWSFVSRFLLTSEILLIGILIGASSISQYVFTSYIAITGISVAAIITSSITPGLGMLIGKKEFNEARKIIDQLRELTFAFAIFTACAILLLNKSFVYLWAAEDLFLSFQSNFLIALIMIQLIIIRNEAFLIDLSLNIRNKVLIGAFSVLLSIILASIAYKEFQTVSSLLIGLLIGRIPLMIIFPIMTNKMTLKNNNLTFRNTYKYIFSALLLLSSSYIGSIQNISSWIELISISLIESLICIILIFFTILDKKNKQLIKSKITKKNKGL